MLQELANENEKLSDLTCQNQAIHGAKIKCEQEMSLMSHDLDEMQACLLYTSPSPRDS